MRNGKGLSSGLVSLVNKYRYRVHLAASQRLERPYAGPSLEDVAAGPSARALVFAPHEDDEVIGCGGTLIRSVRKGARVKVVYMTDGGLGAEGQPDERALIRMDEAKRGLEIMGITDMTFLGFPDGRLTLDRSPVEAVQRIIVDFRPSSVFVPYFLDYHPDHAAVAKIICAALKRVEGNITCYSYEVWTALPPNVIVDVTDVMDLKLRALMEHRSQTEQFDYPGKVVGLNAFRSMSAGQGATHCEAFIRQSKDEYIEMVSR